MSRARCDGARLLTMPQLSQGAVYCLAQSQTHRKISTAAGANNVDILLPDPLHYD